MKNIFLSALLLLTTNSLMANNIQLSNISIGGQNVSGHYEMVYFDVAWENSWRTSTNESNHDGAWIFVKFRKQGTGAWQHATLNTSGNTAPSGSVLQVSADGKGAWIYRNANGTGNVNFTGAQLRWNYGVDGVNDNDDVEVRVFAVEMVYVPQGSFYLGSGGTESHAFSAGGSTNPYLVTSEDAITVGNSVGELKDPYWPSGSIPADYPKGYDAFWMMKYECSQQQYLDFLLCLDEVRFGLRKTSFTWTGAYPAVTAPAPEQAMGYLSYDDVMAYADWAALRPASEMEFEKAGRGANNVPVPNEYPWGNTSIYATSSVLNPGEVNEIAEQGNCTYYPALNRPLRCGIYATATSDRTASGASYYGIMEMGGNVLEPMINTFSAYPYFSRFEHGDGNLTAYALTDVTGWVSVSNTGIISYRAGSHSHYPVSCRLSDRSLIRQQYPSHWAEAFFGLRAARTAE